MTVLQVRGGQQSDCLQISFGSPNLVESTARGDWGEQQNL